MTTQNESFMKFLSGDVEALPEYMPLTAESFDADISAGLHNLINRKAKEFEAELMKGMAVFQHHANMLDAHRIPLDYHKKLTAWHADLLADITAKASSMPKADVVLLPGWFDAAALSIVLAKYSLEGLEDTIKQERLRQRNIRNGGNNIFANCGHNVLFTDTGRR